MGILYVKNTDSKEFTELFKTIQSRPNIIYLDTEDTGLNAFTDKVLLLQLGVGDNIYVLDTFKLGDGVIKGILNSILVSKSLIVGHNVKFDVKMLYVNYGVLLTRVFDTMLAEVLITAGVGDKYPSLSDLVLKYCGVVLDKDVRKEFINKPFGSDFTNNQIMYSAEDILHLEKIYLAQLSELDAQLLGKVCQLENELVPVVISMEVAGISVDHNVWNRLELSASRSALENKNALLKMMFDKVDMSKYKNGLELANAVKITIKTKRDKAALEKLTDPELLRDWLELNFNLDSTTQLPALFKLCGIDTDSTNEKTLNKLPKSEIIDTLLTYRGFNKLATTYGSNILDLVNKSTGRLHTEYQQIGAATGRFSSKNPNLQNIPATDEYRAGFVAEDGWSFINTDYSQQEFRLAGAVSGEEKIIEAYKKGADMHTATASIIYKKPLEDISKKERSFGKTLNFAILYGTTEYGLRRNLNISIDEARDIIKTFYAGYPKLSAFKHMAEEKIAELGYSVTPLGRRRNFPKRPVFASPREIEQFYAGVKREGFNHIIQGGGADITKLALKNLYYKNPFGDKLRIVLQVHDEIGIEVHDSILNDALDYMTFTMKDAFLPFLRGIPAEVESKIGKVWKK